MAKAKRAKLTKLQREDITEQLKLQARIDSSNGRSIHFDDKLIEEMTKGDENLRFVYMKWFTYYTQDLGKTDYLLKSHIDEINKLLMVDNKEYILVLLKYLTDNQDFNINKIVDVEEANKDLLCNTLMKVYNNEIHDRVLDNLEEFYMFGELLEHIRVSVETNDGDVCKQQLKIMIRNKKLYAKLPVLGKIAMNRQSIKSYVDDNYTK